MLRDNPFGYVAVVGGNGVLHFEIESNGQTNYAWLGIVEANAAYYRGQTNAVVFERQWSASGVANAPTVLPAPQVSMASGVLSLEVIGGAPYVPVVMERSADLQHWEPVSTNTPLNGVLLVTDPIGLSEGVCRARQ